MRPRTASSSQSTAPAARIVSGNRTRFARGLLTAPGRGCPPTPAGPPRQAKRIGHRLALASGAGRAMGMVVGPEALLTCAQSSRYG